MCAEVVVIGDGVVRKVSFMTLAGAEGEVSALEVDCQIGTETTSSNSKIVHAGLHYSLGKPNSCIYVSGIICIVNFANSAYYSITTLARLVLKYPTIRKQIWVQSKAIPRETLFRIPKN